jgi:hypothetical protein
LDPTTAAIIATAGLVAIAGFQLALALGAPLGRAAWGGSYDRLPAQLRVSSAVAVVVWLLAASIVLARANVLDLPLPREAITLGAWIVVVLLGLGAIVNFASRSPWERFGWGPFAAILAVLCALVAASDAGGLARG